MNLDGGLNFYLDCCNGEVEQVRLESVRPLQAVRVLHGKPVANALAMLGMMYRICNVAQRNAGVIAARQALGVEVSPSLTLAEGLLLKLETLREHLWQVLVVWPQLSGEKPESNEGLSLLSILMSETEHALFEAGQGLALQSRLKPNRSRLEQLFKRLEQLVKQQVCGSGPDEWLAMSGLAQFTAWLTREEVAPARMMRTLVSEQWQSLGANGSYQPLAAEAQQGFAAAITAGQGEAFAALPTWQAQCCETNAFTRRRSHPLVEAVIEEYGSGLLARNVARLVELFTLYDEVRDDLNQILADEDACDDAFAEQATAGEGLGVVEAARGSLMHHIKVEQGRVADYVILAPTEWNFHPQGVAVEGLKGLRAESEEQLRQQAAMWVNAIDPCVGYELKVNGF